MRGILLIRHGNTTYDDKVDALLNPPLDEAGVERIKRSVKFLDTQDLNLRRIVSSPLQRALKVAEMISRGNVRVTTHNEALPWNLGDLQGKKTSEVEAKIEFLKNYPDLRAPHGESYRTFYNRWSGFLSKLMQYQEAKLDESILVATHSRNINALQSIIGGNPIGDVQEIAPEGSITLLAKNGVSFDYKVIWDGK
jgi:broad specificity phosphatase PhoE